jgi:hypothetical protein
MKQRGEVQLIARHIQGVVEREKDDVPAVDGATGFRSAEDPGMKGMEHDAVAEEEGEGFSLVALEEIGIEFGSSVEDGGLNGGIDAVISVQNPRDRGHADLGGFGDFSEADFSTSGVGLCHSATRDRKSRNISRCFSK